MLARYPVGDACDRDPHVIREDAPVRELVAHLHRARSTALPVVDGQGRLLGMISVQELGRVATDAAALGAERTVSEHA